MIFFLNFFQHFLLFIKKISLKHKTLNENKLNLVREELH